LIKIQGSSFSDFVFASCADMLEGGLFYSLKIGKFYFIKIFGVLQQKQEDKENSIY